MHEDLDSGEVVVHGTPLTDPDDVAQLRHLSPGEVAIVVPRELLVDFGPKEVIRNLWRADAERLRLPTEDFWIFDSRLVAVLNFDDCDNLLDVELITEPAEVNRYAQVRDAAWHYAVPYETFAAGLAAAEQQ